MSRLVDEAVSDYFTLLLTEPEPQKMAQSDAELKPFMPPAEPSVNRRSLEQLFADSKAMATDEVEECNLTVAQTSLTTAEEATSETAPEQHIQAEITAELAQDVAATVDVSSAEQNIDAENSTQDLAAKQPSSNELVSTQALLDSLDEEFQVLFFKVAGLTLAVPLISLGGIVNLQALTPLIGRPAWYKGVQQHRGSQLNVVDTGAWVMPEKYTQELAQQVNYQYVVALQDSNWGLSCETLVDTISIKKSAINWRSQAGKRPWLAGVVKEQMCGILNVAALVQMLQAGLGHQDTIA
ncbi:chemotaxis protein CheW [Shewanella fidelis]|uniref:Chemotaxis protein CheW n=1 Tax=Shewanella fidelis TaxID=173509 RepID=A0AAW8NNZ7_9GAMM|nr:chemotaxis protein CheW [Shewanella fidelis]MDR8524446.1 chemotaxis protein CheW [Shewanella fidelis]MDW4811922.1 chemotaxis protein CheW [Shewanella fidelis]MDW4817139.1 chemotaxis protein CheW [Shewanella fidelis]MDW4821209.1 chemotaxis protein CheW [Shewanella fidelis]MDW4822528.1 chemotaxis protein CheW [Shewanella fidelis]